MKVGRVRSEPHSSESAAGSCYWRWQQRRYDCDVPRRLHLEWVSSSPGRLNLLDRITYGTVIDFMNIGLGPIRIGIFNVADMAIMLGADIVVVAGLRSNRRPKCEARIDDE